VIDVRGTGAVDWMDNTSLLLPANTPIIKVRDESQWKEWARAIIGINEISAFSPPDPDDYDLWHEWAEEFNYAVDL